VLTLLLCLSTLLRIITHAPVQPCKAHSPSSQPLDAHPHPTLLLPPLVLPPSLPIRSTEISRRLFDTCGLEPEHKKIPSCGEHYAVLNSEKLANFQLLSPADGHGPLHVQVLSVLTALIWLFFILVINFLDLNR
jgi:hypothetical protein